MKIYGKFNVVNKSIGCEWWLLSYFLMAKPAVVVGRISKYSKSNSLFCKGPYISPPVRHQSSDYGFLDFVVLRQGNVPMVNFHNHIFPNHNEFLGKPNSTIDLIEF